MTKTSIVNAEMASTRSMDNAQAIMFVTCDDCRQKYVLPREAAGQSKKCRICHAEIRIPWEEYFAEGTTRTHKPPTAPRRSSSRVDLTRPKRGSSLFRERRMRAPAKYRFDMHGSTAKVFGRRIQRLVTSPVVLLTTAVGASLAWWFSDGVWDNWDWAAAALLSVGASTIAYRFTFGARKHAALAREDLRGIGKKRETERLRQIEHSNSDSFDARVMLYVDCMEAAYIRLQQVDRWRCNGEAAKSLEIAEIHDQSCRLYAGCRNMLEQSQKMLVGAADMATDAGRARLMMSREALLAEVQASLQHLGQALDEVFSSQLSAHSQPIDEATELREELNRRVEIVRQVEERMDDFQNEWRK